MKKALIFLTIFLFSNPIFKESEPDYGNIIKPKDFFFGVTGHPLNQKDYLAIPIAEQFEFLKTIGFNYYRLDINIDNNGEIRFNKAIFDSLLSHKKRAGIEILPMLYLYDLDYQDSLGESYKKGYNIGYGFSKKYGKSIKYYELGNESEIPLLLRRDLSGQSTMDFDTTKVKIVARFLDGMNRGIKENYPQSKTIINVGETHVGYFDLLKKYKVEFDILGHHWYTSKLYQSSGHQHIIEQISKIYDYKKPVWITEFNFFQGGLKINENSHHRWMYDYLSKISKNNLVGGIFFYELLDEPSLIIEKSKEYEKHFGIMQMNHAGKYRFKDIHLVFKKIKAN